MARNEQYLPVSGPAIDGNQRAEVHRDVTTADGAASQGARGPGDIPAGCYEVNRHSSIKMRVFSNVSGAAPVIEIYAYPYRSNPEQKGSRLAQLTITCSGSSTPGVNPVTGEATDGVTWYEASTETAATYKIHVDAIKGIPDPSGSWAAVTAGDEMFWRIDPIGFGRLFVRVTNMSTATRLLIALQRESVG